VYMYVNIRNYAETQEIDNLQKGSRNGWRWLWLK